MKVLIFRQGEDTIDITQLVNNVKWSGDKTKACRTLSFNFLKTKEYDIELGDHAVLLNDSDKELYRGVILKRGISQDNIRSISSYDYLFYFANNKDTFVYENMRADEIFNDICGRFQISVGEAANTGYVISNYTVSNRILYDVAIEILSITYKQTGERYYLRAEGDKVNLIKRKDQVYDWVLQTGSNISAYSFDENAEKLVSKVKLVYEDSNDKTELISEEEDGDLITKFGVLQHSEKITDVLNQSQLDQRAKTILKEMGMVESSFKISCLGIDEVITGSAVKVTIPSLNINKQYYIDSDNHTFNDGVHMMDLQLVETNEL